LAQQEPAQRNIAMRLTLESLLVLDAIERKGSFAAAAEELHRVPSAVTYTVQKLEQDLNIALFDRTGHKAQLTPIGKLLLKDGRNLLNAAEEIERRVKRAATGWETEFRIAVSDIISINRLFPMIEKFYTEEGGTFIRIMTEVYGGVWDALIGDRADFALGAADESPPGGGYATHRLGEVEFIFVVASSHPLATLNEPLSSEDIIKHRAIAAADSSRHLAPRTSSLLSGQEVLTVPDMLTKCEAHRHGLGVGYVPRYMVEDDLKTGRLIEKKTQSGAPRPQLYAAWKTSHTGKALNWFLEQIKSTNLLDVPADAPHAQTVNDDNTN
jgi:DNA-binding transcriptional LysR family regulator